MASEQFSLCWDNFHKNMSSGMNSLLESEDLVDVTLAVEGKYLKAHKMVLSVCSPYFKDLFKANPCQHPIVFMKDVSYVAISDLLQFMYQGEVQVSQDNLTTFIKTAEALQIKGLTGDGNGSADADSEPPQEKTSSRHVEEYKPISRPKKPLPAPVVTTTPAPKRPRLSVSSNDSQSAPAPITKTEPISTPISSVDTSSVQFKVEPYDQNQSVTIPDDGDDNFGDDTLDDNTVDDNEDYSMMEGDEPQAGTSTDGTGEGQALSILRINNRLRVSEVYTSESEKETSPEKSKMSEHVTSKSETGASPVLLRIPDIKANLTLESEKKNNAEKSKIPEVNDYVVVRRPLTEKSAVHYVAIILSKAENKAKVKFLSNILGNKFIIPFTYGISFIYLDEVVEILSQPTINNREYTFNLDFTKYKNMN